MCLTKIARLKASCHSALLQSGSNQTALLRHLRGGFSTRLEPKWILVSLVHNVPIPLIQLMTSIASPMIGTFVWKPVVGVNVSSCSPCTMACFLCCVPSSLFSPHGTTSSEIMLLCREFHLDRTTCSFVEIVPLIRSSSSDVLPPTSSPPSISQMCWPERHQGVLRLIFWCVPWVSDVVALTCRHCAFAWILAA